MPMIFSDVFKIITNMDIFQHDELSKNTNLKSSQSRKIQESKKRVKWVLKKSTPETITNDNINEKPSQHERMKKNIIYFLKKRIRERKKSHLSFTQSAALHPAANYASCVSKPTDDYLEAERGCKIFLDNFGFFRIF